MRYDSGLLRHLGPGAGAGSGPRRSTSASRGHLYFLFRGAAYQKMDRTINRPSDPEFTAADGTRVIVSGNLVIEY